MAKAQVAGAVAGTVVTITFYLWLGLRGIIPALVLMAAVQLAIAWHFAKRLPVLKVEMTWRESLNKAGAMVRLGLVMMWTGLMGSAVAYATAVLITQQINVQAVGIYSAAFALSGMFVNFVLQAMGADYYPRLTAAADDHAKVNRLVNEQTEIGLLLALPGLLATMVLAPWIVQIFYTKEFLLAVELIQWFLLGCLGRVISWPLGFVLIALKRTKTYFQLEVFWNLLHIGLISTGLIFVGLEGVAIAFGLLYLVVTSQCLLTLRRLTMFHWSLPARQLVYVALFFIFTVFFLGHLPSGLFISFFMIAILIATSLFSLRALVRRLDREHSLVRAIVGIPGGSFLLGKRA
jgi:PST family polysaccharide transporter